MGFMAEMTAPVGEGARPRLTEATVERARGALMLHYSIDSHSALALLARWARQSGTDVPTVSQTLLHAVCEGHTSVESDRTVLVRWIEEQMRRAADAPPDGEPGST